MEGYPKGLRWLIAIALIALSGSSCAWLNRPRRYPLPAALSPTPTLEEVIRVVNNNSAQIQSFYTDEARLSVPGIPSLRTTIAFERPKRLRLRAGTGISGTELDVGSNDELFWTWVARQPPLYYCRHDQFAASPARRLIPIEPQWLIEALGIAEFDPAATHEGPNLRPGGRLAIRTVQETLDGPAAKTTVVDAVTGVVLERQLYDRRGVLVAKASASNHRRDPATGLIMPGTVDIQCPPAGFSVRIDLGNVRINPPLANPAELWAMPTFDGWPMVNLADPNLQLAPSARSPAPLVTSQRIEPPAMSSRLSHPVRGQNRMLH